MALRFAVGDRVECRTSGGGRRCLGPGTSAVGEAGWEPGAVTVLHYREDHWPEGRVVPYQVALDTGVLIFAPQDDDQLIRADASSEGAQGAVPQTEVLVCQAGSCRRAGGQAVLMEIEELVSGVGAVSVQPSGCLGNCSQAPNVLVACSQGKEKLFAQVCDLANSAAVVERATGQAPNLGDPQMVARLSRARRLRVRNQAREESKWNLALSGMAEDVASARSQEDRLELMQERADLLAAAGLTDQAVEILSAGANLKQIQLADIPQLRLVIGLAEILSAAGRPERVRALLDTAEQLEPRGGREANVQAQVVRILQDHEARAVPATGEPRIRDYALWRLDSLTVVSKHSAIYHFRSEEGEQQRGTPIARGRRKRIQWPKTWHTTLLARVGEEANKEGPLPWLERDYTPISTAHDWEHGRCDILIKTYLEPNGAATSWLHQISAQLGAVKPTVWLSKPMKTMSVPSLVVDDLCLNRKHSSVLLVVAGTGVVAVPSVLHHADQDTCFDLKAKPPVTQPITVIYSCRRDDALMVPELATWCKAGMLQRCVLLVTEARAGIAPFPEYDGQNITDSFAGLENATNMEQRLSIDLLKGELDKLVRPLRIVVSGPDGFNGAAKHMLEQLDVEAEAITILSA